MNGIKLYEERDDVFLTPYLFDTENRIHPGSKRPAVVIMPGGSFTKVSSREGEPIARAFNAMGYHAFVLNYSVYGEETIVADYKNDTEIKDYVALPVQVKELALALNEIEKKAEEWNIDNDRIGLVGMSAGGHVAAMYSNLWNDEDFVQEALEPAFVVLGYPFLDMVRTFQGEDEGQVSRTNVTYTDSMVESLFGSLEVAEDHLKKLSPVHYVDENTPPTFIWSTSEDEVVDVRDSLDYATALAKNSVPFEVHVFKEGIHGLSIADYSSASRPEQINPIVHQWVKLCKDWIEQL